MRIIKSLVSVNFRAAHLLRMLDPVSAISVAAAACQFAEQTTKLFNALHYYVSNLNNAPKLSRDLRREALLVSDVLAELRSSFSADDQDNSLLETKVVTDMIKEFEETIKAMAERVEIKDKEISLKRFQWPFKKRESEEYLRKLERFKTTFQLALQTRQKYFPLFAC